MRLTPLLVYILGIFALAAVTAYPAFSLLVLLGVEEVTFDELVMRLLKVYALLGLWPLLAMLGINRRESWGYGPGPGGRGFFKGLALGTGIGIAMLGAVALALLALEVRVAKPGLEITSASVGVLVLKSVISGLLVGLIEETWFRGALHSGITRMSNTLFAIVFISVVYGAVHFIDADVNIPADEVRWSSGIVVLANCFHRFRDTPFADSLFALVAAGFFLALIRHHTGRVAECIGIHAGWVMVIQVFRKLTYPNTENSWTFVVGSFDGVIGLLAGLWFTALGIAYFLRYVRRIPAPGS